MIVVHHLENSRSQRILWLLEELGVPYEVKRYQRNPQTMLAPTELLRVHPLGKSPVVTDGARTLAETGAIVEYLLDRYGDRLLRPDVGTPDRDAFIFWLHFAEGSAMPPLVMKLVFDRIPGRVPFFIRPIANAIARAVGQQFLDPTLERQMRFMDTALASSGWFAGTRFSAADIMMSFPVESAAVFGVLDRYMNLEGWLKTVHERPAYQAALERGGAYALAGAAL